MFSPVYIITAHVFSCHTSSSLLTVILGQMVSHVKMGPLIKKLVHQLPQLALEASVQPITRTVLRVRLDITPDFNWDDKVGSGQTAISLLLLHCKAILNVFVVCWDGYWFTLFTHSAQGNTVGDIDQVL